MISLLKKHSKKIIFCVILAIISYLYFTFSTFYELYLWKQSKHVGKILLIISILSLFSVRFYQKQNFKYLLSVFVLLQLCLIFTLPPVHNDVFRYMYDGTVSRFDIHNKFSGNSSFKYTPEQVQKLNIAQKDLEHTQKVKSFVNDQWWWDLLDFKHLHTIYPGTAQTFFLVSSFFLGYEIIIFRLILLCASLFLIFYLLKLFDSGNHNSNDNLLPFILFNPIFFFDGILGIHLEMLLIMFLIIAIYYFQQKKYFIAGAALSFSIFTKLYPILLLPVFLLQKGISYQKFLLGLLVGSLINIPFLYQKIHYEHLWGSIKRFQADWVASPGLYTYFEQIFGTDASIFSMIILIIILLFTYYLVLNRKITLLNGVCFILVSYLFLAKTIFSWYLLPILVLFPFITGPYKFIVITPLIFYSLQYFFIDGTNDINVTFIYDNNGTSEWFHTITWWPVVYVGIMITIYKIKKYYLK